MLTLIQNPQKRPKLKKDLGIPNLFPYKDCILHEIEEKQRLKREEASAARKDASMVADEEMGQTTAADEDQPLDGSEAEDEEPDAMDQDGLSESGPMAALLESARARATAYDERAPSHASVSASADEDDPVALDPKRALDPDTRSYANIFPDVLSRADVILYVLDARDPLSTRSPATELQIAKHGDGSKKIILVLNKIDLVPPHALSKWLRHLRRSHPTLPLRASDAAASARTYDHKAMSRANTAVALLRALKSYAAHYGVARALTVAVAGYPNVGKSSVVNALAARHGRKSEPAPTGAEAGITTAVHTIKLDSKLHLLDSPGVIFPTADPDRDAEMADGKTSRQQRADHNARLALLNALPLKQINDPTRAIGLLLARVAALPEAQEHLQTYYGLTPLALVRGDRTTDFLVQVARKRGRLGKGGVPNLEAAARSVLADWRDGSIGAWVEPPIDQRENGAREESKEVVQTWGKEFMMEGLWGRYDPNEEDHGEAAVVMEA